MREEVKELVRAVPARWLKPAFTLAVVAVLALGAWVVRAHVRADEKQTADISLHDRDLTSLSSAVTQLLKMTADQQDEVKGFRQEMKELRKEQVDTARHIQRALDLLEQANGRLAARPPRPGVVQ